MHHHPPWRPPARAPSPAAPARRPPQRRAPTPRTTAAVAHSSPARAPARPPPHLAGIAPPPTARPPWTTGAHWWTPPPPTARPPCTPWYCGSRSLSLPPFRDATTPPPPLQVRSISWRWPRRPRSGTAAAPACCPRRRLTGAPAAALRPTRRHRRREAGTRRFEIGEVRRTQTVVKTKGGAEREVRRPWIRKRGDQRRGADNGEAGHEATSGGAKRGGDGR